MFILSGMSTSDHKDGDDDNDADRETNLNSANIFQSVGDCKIHPFFFIYFFLSLRCEGV